MSDLVIVIRQSVEQDARLRTAILAGLTVVLAIAFMVLLISDQVQAAAF